MGWCLSCHRPFCEMMLNTDDENCNLRTYDNGRCGHFVLQQTGEILIKVHGEDSHLEYPKPYETVFFIHGQESSSAPRSMDLFLRDQFSARTEEVASPASE
ncbi:uncharacterized protein [Ptychodera flava]|uniref:uncharacterized protein n=1 Tax=Ptychodera flava TaxID=63121 RepID=UPI003969EC4B